MKDITISVLLYFLSTSTIILAAKITETWKPVELLRTKPGLNLTEVSTVKSIIEAGNVCSVSESCKLFCFDGSQYFSSELEIIPEYYEVATGETYKCWTRLARGEWSRHSLNGNLTLNQSDLFTVIQFSILGSIEGTKRADGFYYLSIDDIVGSFEVMNRACQRYGGYRLGICRSPATFQVMQDIKNENGKFFIK